VQGRFEKLLGTTDFTEADKKAYAGHVNSIVARLRSSFQISKFQVFGSVSRQTAIRQQSDVDLLVVLEPVEVIWGGSVVTSKTVLVRLRDELADRFPNTSLRRDGEAVVVPFKDGYYPIDVVPGYQTNNYEQHECYGIPTADGCWQATSPGAHKSFILKANLLSGGQLCKTARLAKLWRCIRTPEFPLSSFHVEMLLASEGICQRGMPLAACLFALFKRLHGRECRAIRDPLGIGGLIGAARTEAQRDTLMQRVAYAVDHASAALNAECAGGWREAVRQWDIVFNGQFPTT
jgi:predicted nucleotidyltransferase